MQVNEERLESVPLCDFCERSDFRLWFDAGHIKIVRCQHCGLMFLTPRLRKEALRDLYNRHEYYQDVSPASSKLIHVPFYVEMLNRIKTSAKASGSLRLLEVGAGGGLLSKCAALMGYDVTAQEISRPGIERLRAWGIKVIDGDFEELTDLGCGFDAVIALHLIEHMQSVRVFLDKVYRCLNSRGVLILQVPNFGSADFKFNSEIFSKMLSLPYHNFFFTPKTLGRYLKAVKFRITSVEYNLPFWIRGLSTLFREQGIGRDPGQDPAAFEDVICRTVAHQRPGSLGREARQFLRQGIARIVPGDCMTIYAQK